ncbi:hypothetical protein D3C86_1604020 [compost metagenome]
MALSPKIKARPVPTIDQYRLVAYNQKTIQVVRNLDGFIDYHATNPGTLKHCLTQMIVACTQKEATLSARVKSAKANKDYPHRPKMHETVVTTPNGKSTVRTREYTYAELMETSMRWMKGIIMQAYGAQGFDIIKEAEADAVKHFSIS